MTMKNVSQSQDAPSPTEWMHISGNSTASISDRIPPSDVAKDEHENESPPAKRRREDRERTRVSRACDRCKKKKTRCTGRCPCTLCLRAGLPCEFTAAYTRGRLPSVIVDEAAMTPSTRPRMSMSGRVSVSASESSPKDTASAIDPNFTFQRPLDPSPSMEPSRAGHVFSHEGLAIPAPTKSAESSSDPLSRTSPEPTQTDSQGHYVGSSSAVSFLLRIQKRLHQNSSFSHDSSIFTFGDAPLPEHDPSFFVLPSKADAQRLVERYFDFASPTHRFLHRPSIERLLEEFYETTGAMRNKEDAKAKTALLLIVLAQAQAHMPPGSAVQDNSARYFFAAEQQLSKERGAVRLASVQARLGQCFYLLSQSRINHCWSLFGTTSHLALAIGLNRARRCDPCTGTVDLIELESRRRLFWCVYTLDKYLAAALGRPRTFKDEDIDQDLPTIVNDNDLYSTHMNPTPASQSHSISLMMAPVQHFKLSQIVSLVLRDLYPIRPPSITQRIDLAAKYSKELLEWRSNLSRFLDAGALDSSLLIPLFQRQRSVLNLAYYHTVLLVQRPFLLSNFASLTRLSQSHTNASLTGPLPDTTPNIHSCLEAALAITRVVDEIFNGTRLSRAFWFTQYYAFCAVVVLYIYRIQQHIITPGKCEGYFAAAHKCHQQLQSVSEVDCLARRYCLVLEELRVEADRIRSQAQNHNGAGTPSHADHQNNNAINSLGVNGSLSATSTTDAALQNVVASATGPTGPHVSTPQSNAPDAAFYSTTGDPNNIPPTPESEAFNSNLLNTSSIMADLTSWGQFDSLVTAGIGMLDGGFHQGGEGFGGLGWGM